MKPKVAGWNLKVEDVVNGNWEEIHRFIKNIAELIAGSFVRKTVGKRQLRGIFLES